jgi:hypothetical protein
MNTSLILTHLKALMAKKLQKCNIQKYLVNYLAINGLQGLQNFACLCLYLGIYTTSYIEDFCTKITNTYRNICDKLIFVSH